MDEDQDAKTEAPSQRKRDESRQQGNVAFSPELNTGILLLIGVLFLWFGGSAIVFGFEDSLRTVLAASTAEMSFERIQSMLQTQLGQILKIIGGFLLVMFLGSFFSSYLQVGFIISTEAIMPKLEKINPIDGFFRLFSIQGLAKAVVALAKVGLIAGVAYWMLKDKGLLFAKLASISLSESVATVWDLSLRLVVAIVAALFILGVGDFAWQYWRHEKSLMMTKEETKQEFKNDEGNPEIKARRKQIAREIASRKRMLKDVPEATVVVTNPTHIAVALKYDRGKMAAPLVIAMGKGAFARRIVELAKKHAIPVLERKPLAQVLSKEVKVGQEIPVALYYAVSEVLAYVYKLRHGPPG